MDADEVYGAVARVLRREREANDTTGRQLADLQARFDKLFEVLTAQGVLAPGHAKLFERVGGQAAGSLPARVRLRQYVDKHSIANPDIDCAALMPLCHGRCCAFSFDLTTQDLDDGVRWEIERPYTILHERDGYCTHFVRPGGGCTIYDKRPASCRGYDCRSDPRVWIDYQKRIPAPMGDLQPPRAT